LPTQITFLVSGPTGARFFLDTLHQEGVDVLFGLSGSQFLDVLDLVRDCDVMLASHMGPPMVRSLKQLGKRVLFAPNEDLKLSLGAYMEAPEGGLNEYTVEQAAPPPGHEPHDHQH